VLVVLCALPQRNRAGRHTQKVCIRDGTQARSNGGPGGVGGLKLQKNMELFPPAATWPAVPAAKSAAMNSCFR
jgi:hypothetical protein